jgi:phage terminase large subunit GpA-like protein
MLPAEWGRNNRIYPPSAGVPGPRNPDLTPYAIAPTNAVASGLYRRVVVVFAAQSGKTDGVLDIIGWRLDQKPCAIIYVGPNKQFLTEQFEPRVMGLLDEADCLSAKVQRGKRMTKTRKMIGGVSLRLAHAGSTTALKADPCGLAILDEYVDMKALKNAGSPLALVEARGETFADFVAFITSTPSQGVTGTKTDELSGLEFWDAEPKDIECPIWKLWAEGTRRHFVWKCKSCHEYFVPRFKNLHWPPKATPQQALRTAYVQCPNCVDGKHYEADKEKLNATGLYVAPGQWIENGVVMGEPPESSTDSYWASGLCSPFKTFGERAERFLTAARSGDMDEMRAAINSAFGEMWVPKGGELPEVGEVVAHKLEYRMGEGGDYAVSDVPAGVVALTAGVDVQKNRLIVVVRGWGPGGESWLIWQGELWGRSDDKEALLSGGGTDRMEVWQDLTELLQTPIGPNRMVVAVAIIDSGFRPNKKDAGDQNIIYEYCLQNAHFARAGKGFATLRAPIMLSKLEVTPRGRVAPYSIELVRINSDFAKSWVHSKIRWPVDQPGAWHLPANVTDDYIAQILSESRIVKPSGQVTWIQTSVDNHYLDCEAMAFAAGYRINVHRIPRDREPPPRAPAGGEGGQETPVTPTTNADPGGKLVSRPANRSQSSFLGRRR